jgi:chromosome segregation ATPase
VAELKASVEALTETNLETSESLRCVQGEVVEAQREIERLTFERDSAKEDADNLFTQAETLKEDVASITKNFEDVKASSGRKSEQVIVLTSVTRYYFQCRLSDSVFNLTPYRTRRLILHSILVTVLPILV